MHTDVTACAAAGLVSLIAQLPLCTGLATRAACALFAQLVAVAPAPASNPGFGASVFTAGVRLTLCTVLVPCSVRRPPAATVSVFVTVKAPLIVTVQPEAIVR